MRSSLDPEALSRLANLHLRARSVVEGVLSGLHRSPHHGQSIEFTEHKEYSPGDDLRHLDWKAFGRLDKYYLKRFEHETNLRAYLVVDASASMGYASGAQSKLSYATTVAAALTMLLARQQDAVGLFLAHGGEVRFIPPHASPAHASALIELLDRVSPAGGTDLGAIAQAVAERARRRSLVLVLSDLFDLPKGEGQSPAGEEGLRKILQLRALRHEVALFHVLDPAELLFPFDDPTLFISMEDDRRLEANPAQLREGYLEEMGRFLAGSERLCQDRDCDYELLRTDEPVDRGLLRFLARRNRRPAGSLAP